MTTPVRRGLAAIVAMTVATGLLAAPDGPTFPSAEDSDPARLGWMQGSPPPAERLIRHDDMSFYAFPRTRWSFANMRQLAPSVNVWRGDAPPSPLEHADAAGIDALTFSPSGSNETMSWETSLAENYTDAIIVMHRGKVIYERYFGVMTSHTPHMAMSVTKSFVGTLVAMLVHEGRLDPDATVANYIPELGASAFGDATVRQVMDMTTGIRFSEDYSDPDSDIWRHSRAGGTFPFPPGYSGPKNFYESLRTLTEKVTPHGKGFSYKSANTDVLGWLIRRVTGHTLAQELSERFWQPMGAQEDAYMLVDTAGIEFAAGGLNLSLRDMARFGEMLRCGGRFNGRQVVPEAVVEDIRAGASREDFRHAGFALPGWSYKSQWWITHNDHGAWTARGVHGQAIYIDPAAEMVIARFGSHPKAANANFDATSLPAFERVATWLITGH